MKAFPLVLVALSAPATAAQAPFPACQYPYGPNNGPMRILDVNGDGAPDATLAIQDSFRVLSGDGAGGFGPPASYLTGGSGPLGLDYGDFDNDGLLDPAIACFNTKDVRILKNGQTSFPLWAVAALGIQVVNVFARDLDNDGALDLAVLKGYVSPPDPTDFYVSLQSGGTFSPPSSVTLLPTLQRLTFLDANGDGNLDVVGGLLSSGTQPRLCLALGAGTGAFGQALPIRRSQALGRDVLTTADLNFDGKLDLLVADDSGKTLSAGLNLGDGGFDFQSSTNPNDGTVGDDISMGDLDGNGTIDAVTAHGLVFFGNTTAGFGAPTRYEVGGFSQQVGTADLDGNGTLDAAFRIGSTQSIEVLLGAGGGRLVAPRELVAPFATIDFAIGRVNGDGLTDVVVGWQGLLQVFLATLPGNYASTPGVAVQALEKLVLDDVNNDGNNDVIVARSTVASKLVEVRVGDGVGGFTASALLTLPGGGTPSVARVAITDLDADGKADVVATTNTTGLTRFLGNADGTFGPDLTTPIGAGIVNLVVGDWNLDGNIDVAAVASFPERLYLAMGDGSGSFPQSSQLNLLTAPSSIATGDVNLDGHLDLAVGHGSTTQGVMFLKGGGAGGSFTGGILYNAYDPVASVALGDSDGDGVLDVVAATGHPGSGLVLFPGKSVGAFGIGVRFGTGYSDPTHKATFADVNLDGRLDIVHSSLAEGTFVLTNLLGLPAGVSAFGTGTFGCQGTHGASASGTPKLGSQDFVVHATNAPPFGDGWLLVGDVPDPAGNDLLNFGALLHVEPLASSFCQVIQIGADTKGLGLGPFTLPANPGLAGKHLYMQTIWAWPNCPILPLGFSSSRALDVILQAP